MHAFCFYVFVQLLHIKRRFVTQLTTVSICMDDQLISVGSFNICFGQLSGRVAFYDDTGVIRDVMQNHLTEILALIAMDLPGKRATINQVLANKVAILRRVSKLDASGVLIGQYHEYPAEAQIEFNNTAHETLTPTFAASVVYVNNQRWRGVPFVLTSGKKLDEKASYVRIVFKSNRLCIEANSTACAAAKQQLMFHIASSDARIQG